jgi:hypothetical protein
VQGLLGLAVLRVPRAAGEAWARSSFRLSPVALACVGWGLVIISALFFGLAALQAPGNLALFAAVSLAGLAVHAWRGRHQP